MGRGRPREAGCTWSGGVSVHRAPSRARNGGRGAALFTGLGHILLGPSTWAIPLCKSRHRAGPKDRAAAHPMAWRRCHSCLFCFQDFVTALSILLRGTVHEKLRWTFNLYDINKDGYINKEVSELWPRPGEGHRQASGYCRGEQPGPDGEAIRVRTDRLGAHGARAWQKEAAHLSPPIALVPGTGKGFSRVIRPHWVAHTQHTFHSGGE